MGFLKKKNKISDEIKNEVNEEEETESSLFGEEEEFEQTSEYQKEIEDQEILGSEENKKEEATNTVSDKKFDIKNMDKKQKIAFSLIAFGILGYFAFSGGNNNSDTKNELKKEISQVDIKVDENMDILTASKNKDFLSRLKTIEEKLNNSDLSKNVNGNGVDIEKIKAKKYKAYQELSLLLFTSQYKISNNEFIYRKENQIYHHLFQGNEILLDKLVAIALNNGALLRLENLDTDYIINDNNVNDHDFQDYKNIDIWRIDPNTGLKKVLTNDTKKDILSYLDNMDNPEDILIKKYTNKILLIGKNAEIKDEVDFYSKKSNDITVPKNIIKYYSIQEYTTEDFKKISVTSDNILIDGVEKYTKKGLYSMKYMKYNDPDKGITEKLFIYLNGKIIDAIPLNSVRNISLVNYKNKEGEEYVQKDNSVLKLNQQTGLLEEIGIGNIFGKITDGKLDSVSLVISESSEERLPINNLIGKILIDENKIQYKVTEDGVNYQDTLLPITSFSITSSGFLFYEDEKIAKIKEIKMIDKTGASIKTSTKIINLISKTKYEVYDLNENLIFSDNTYKEVKFNLDFKNEMITATATISASIDNIKKTINGIGYDTYENRNNVYFLFDNEGTLIKEIPEIEKKVLFKEKIIGFELISGEMFDYYFQIDTLSGKIDSNEVGKFIQKYQKDKIPFSQFKQTNNFKTLNTTIDSRIQNNSFNGQSVILLNDLLEGRKFPYISFKDISGNNIKILDEKNLLINGKDTIEGLKIYLNIAKSKFLLNVLPKMIDRNISRRYKLKIINKTLNWFFKDISLDDYDYIENKTGTKYFRDQEGTFWIKTKDNKEFKEVLSTEIDLLNDKFVIVDVSDNSYNLKLSDLTKMTDKETKIYKKLLKRFLNPEETSEAKNRKEKEAKERAERLKKSEAYKKQMQEFENQNSTMKTIVLNQKKINEIKSTKQEPDFVFEIGTKLPFIIKESMEVTEGEKSFALGHISNLVLKDLSDREIHIRNANVVLGLEGDFSKQKINVNPLKIIYKDPETNDKRVIDIPQSATQFIYKEEGFNLVGVPSYMINAKLKNIDTTVILSTVSGILENLTQPQDTLSTLTNGLDTTGTTGTDNGTNQNQTIGQAAGAGINQGIQDLINTIKESTDKDKNILISEPNVKGYSLFIEEVEVDYGEKK